MSILDPRSRFEINGRVYEIIDFWLPGEDPEKVKIKDYLARGRELDASMGQEDGEFLWRHRDRLPLVFQQSDYGNLFLIFPEWTKTVETSLYINRSEFGDLREILCEDIRYKDAPLATYFQFARIRRRDNVIVGHWFFHDDCPPWVHFGGTLARLARRIS